MKTYPLTLSLLAASLLAAACGSMPATSLLDQAREDYRVVQSSPKVATYAPLELQQAGDALAQANTSADHKDSQEKVDKLTYIAKQKIALAWEVTKQKSAEAQSADAGKQRDQMLLNQRTAEADRAKMQAQQAQMDANGARQITETAQADAAAAQLAARNAQDRNAQLQAQLNELAAKKTDHGIVITLGDVLFGTDLARLNAEGMRNAQKLATLLQQNPNRKVLVEGFTDSTGTTAHNQELSERRANAVRTGLLEMGIASNRIAIRGKGEAMPVAANDTAANRQLNRRVEISLSDETGAIQAR